MKQFTDSAGRAWTIAITIDAVKRVRAALPEVDLLNPMAGTPPLLTRLETDLGLLVDVIFVICRPQAEKLGVTDEQFGAAMGGEAVTLAHDAFWHDLTDFFRQLRRPEIVTAIEKQTATVRQTIALMDQRIQEIDIQREIDKHFGKPSTSSPGSSEPTQGP